MMSRHSVKTAKEEYTTKATVFPTNAELHIVVITAIGVKKRWNVTDVLSEIIKDGCAPTELRKSTGANVSKMKNRDQNGIVWRGLI